MNEIRTEVGLKRIRRYVSKSTADHWLGDAVAKKCGCHVMPEDMGSFPHTGGLAYPCFLHDFPGDVSDAPAVQRCERPSQAEEQMSFT